MKNCLPVYFSKGKISIWGNHLKVWISELIIHAYFIHCSQVNYGLQLLLKTCSFPLCSWRKPVEPHRRLSRGFILEAHNVIFILNYHDSGFPIEIATWLPKLSEITQKEVVRIGLIISRFIRSFLELKNQTVRFVIQ